MEGEGDRGEGGAGGRNVLNKSFSNSPPWLCRTFDGIPYLNLKSLERHSAVVLPFLFIVGCPCVNPEK